MPIRCITFDLDDTLWDAGDLLLDAERSFFQWINEELPRVAEQFDFNTLVQHRRRHYDTYPDQRHDLTHMRKHWLSALCAEFGYDEQLAEPGFRVFFERRNAVLLYEGTEALLKQLGSRYTIGAITNGNADLDHIGISHHFNFVVSSASAGAAKPHPRIFESALQAGNVSAEDTVHVGDDAARDVVGAAAMGMRTVWVNPTLSPWPGGSTPDAVVRAVAELPGVLARMK